MSKNLHIVRKCDFSLLHLNVDFVDAIFVIFNMYMYFTTQHSFMARPTFVLPSKLHEHLQVYLAPDIMLRSTNDSQ